MRRYVASLWISTCLIIVTNVLMANLMQWFPFVVGESHLLPFGAFAPGGTSLES